MKQNTLTQTQIPNRKNVATVHVFARSTTFANKSIIMLVTIETIDPVRSTGATRIEIEIHFVTRLSELFKFTTTRTVCSFLSHTVVALSPHPNRRLANESWSVGQKRPGNALPEHAARTEALDRNQCHDQPRPPSRLRRTGTSPECAHRSRWG